MEPITEEPCLLDSSIILVASNDTKMAMDTNKEEKLTRGMSSTHEPKVHELSSRVLFDLNLCSEESIHASKLEVNQLIPVHGDVSHANQSILDEAHVHGKKPIDQSRVFSCKFCKSEFSTPRALGGHQSAHRQEHALIKRAKGMALVPFRDSHQHYPYVGLSNHPYRGSVNRSLGVKMKTLIHKTSYHSLLVPSNGLYHYVGFSKQAISSFSPSSIDRTKIESMNVINGGGFGLHGLPFGENKSSLFNNLHSASSSSIVTINQQFAQVRLSEQVDDSGIDLSLKL